jgi:multiple sugar transport system substrate-binding protein
MRNPPLLALLALALPTLLAVRPAAAQDKLTVWFNKGFYPAEDAAVDEAVARFTARTGVKVELSRFPTPDMVPKTVAAMDGGNPPDVAYGDTFDFNAAAKWAYEGKLEDLTDILKPMKGEFLPNTLATAALFNNRTRRRAYYAFPVKRQTMHVQYWKDMLQVAGYSERQIPRTWRAYWRFWCDKVQPAYRRKTGKEVFSVGSPMGVESTDSFYSFLTFADAYNVRMVDKDGRLTINQPSVHRGLTAALRDYVSTLQKGCTPPAAVTWKDADNNASFHNRSLIMTHNATISIASKWLDDSNNEKLPAAERATARNNYEQLVRVAEFPAKPDGTPMVYRQAVKVGVVFAASKNKKRAKEFVQFLLQDENLTPLVEGSLGRWYPVTKSGAARPFWTNDPHRRTVHKQFTAGTVNFEFTKNYRFSILNTENVWARAINRVATEKWPPEKAVDELLARIRQIAGS